MLNFIFAWFIHQGKGLEIKIDQYLCPVIFLWTNGNYWSYYCLRTKHKDSPTATGKHKFVELLLDFGSINQPSAFNCTHMHRKLLSVLWGSQKPSNILAKLKSPLQCGCHIFPMFGANRLAERLHNFIAVIITSCEYHHPNALIMNASKSITWNNLLTGILQSIL